MSDDELNDPLDVADFFYSCDSIQSIGTSLPVASALLGILEDSCAFGGASNTDSGVSNGEAITNSLVGGGLISRLEQSFLESTPTFSHDASRSLEGSNATTGFTTQAIASEQEASQNRVLHHPWNHVYQEDVSRGISNLFASPIGDLAFIEASPSIPRVENSFEPEASRGILPPASSGKNSKRATGVSVCTTVTGNATERGHSPSHRSSTSTVEKELMTMTNVLTSSQRPGVEEDYYRLSKPPKRTRSASNGYSKTVWKKIAARTQLGENGREETFRSSLLEQAAMNASTTFKTSGIKRIRKDSQSSSNSNNTLGHSNTVAESSTSIEAFSLAQQRVERSILRNSTSRVLISLQQGNEESTNSLFQHQLLHQEPTSNDELELRYSQMNGTNKNESNVHPSKKYPY